MLPSPGTCFPRCVQTLWTRTVTQQGSWLIASSVLTYVGLVVRHPIPVMLLARLAAHKDWQGKGIGQALLRDAVLRTCRRHSPPFAEAEKETDL